MPELTPDQITGIDTILKSLCTNRGFILADKMGLGKTVQALEVAKRAVQTGPVLVFCPGYLTYTWEEEINFWDITDNYQRVQSNELSCKKDIYIMSYERACAIPVLKWAHKQKFPLVICDEAHYLKSKNSKRTRKILGNGINPVQNYLNWSKKMLLVTGTPIINRVGELYPILSRVFPEKINMSELEFIHYFAEEIIYTPFGPKHIGVKNTEELRKLLAPILLCRKSIVGLPDKIEKTIVPPETMDVLKTLDADETFCTAHGITADTILSAQKLTKTDRENMNAIRRKVALHKIPTLINLVGDIWEKEDTPLIIYSYYRETQARTVQELCRVFPKKVFAVINGEISPEKRNTILHEYRDGKIDCIIATLGSFKEGVTATTGNNVILLEHDWTPAGDDQAISRVHRKGQKKQVCVYHILYQKGFDKYLMELLNAKRQTIKKVFGA